MTTTHMKMDSPMLGLIQNNSTQPLYQQIKRALAGRIIDGDYQPHERLPSESELMKVFGVSRITVRQALRDLHREGLVFSVQGKGTFVSKPKAVQDVQRLQGYETSTRVIDLKEVRPPQDVAEALGIRRTEGVMELRRVRHLNSEPISIDHSFYPLAIGNRLAGEDLSQDVFPMLEDRFNIQLSHADLHIEATIAGDDEVKLLRCEEGAPVLSIRRAVFDEDDNRVAFEILSYRGESFQYHLTVRR